MDSDRIKLEDRSPDHSRSRDRERSRRGDRPSRFSSNTRDRSPVRERRNRGDRRVYVSNVAYESKWQDIKDLFRAEVGEVTYVELFVDENEKPRGCGIVEFETPEMAARAVEKMHRFDLKGRKLVVKEDSDVTRDKYGRVIPSRNSRSGNDDNNLSSTSRREDNSRSNTWDGYQHSTMNSNTPPSTGSSGNSSNKWGNTYGLSHSFLESLSITGPLVSKVFVANLDYKVDEKKFREVFRLAGKVIHAEISMDKEGKSRGFGVVEYEHPVEAVQAISLLHNQTLFDRRLTVRMDRAEKQDGPPKLPEGLKGIGLGLGQNGSILQDVPRNLPSISNNVPMPALASQQLQAAAVAQAQAQFAQNNQLGQPTVAVNQGPLAHLGGASALTPALTNMTGLLGQGVNVQDLANINSFNNPAALTNLGLNVGITSGLGGVPVGFGVGGSGLGSSLSHLNSSDSMSAALSGNNSSGRYSNFDRENFGGREDYNGSRVIGNGRGNVGNNNPTTNARRTDTVIVKNLPPGVQWHHFVEKFREVGDVRIAEMQSKDSGLIKFSSEWEAERAVRDFDRTRYEGRTIDVMLYY